MIPRWIALFLFACGTAVSEAEAPSPKTPPSTPTPVAAPEREGHGEHGDHHEAANATLPTTLPETVRALKAHRDQVKVLVDTGKLSDIHPLTEQMGKLVVLLPVRAKDLAPADKTTITIAGTDLKGVLDALHHAADEGSAEGTRAQLALLDEHLAKLSAYE